MRQLEALRCCRGGGGGMQLTRVNGGDSTVWCGRPVGEGGGARKGGAVARLAEGGVPLGAWTDGVRWSLSAGIAVQHEREWRRWRGAEIKLPLSTSLLFLLQLKQEKKRDQTFAPLLFFRFLYLGGCLNIYSCISTSLHPTKK